jgi:cytochrome c biogenesis protein CcdA/thiol-disulfide isomerase/thioredoxin
MALLILFAFIAGIGTALSPCVLPVLPIALSAGATGGRRRPLGIVTGLALSFTFVTVAFVYVIHWLGLPNDLLRKVAIVGLILFGIALAVPPLGDRLEAWLSRIVPARASRRGGEGFGSGLLVGLGLGAVYTPCAGPILAGVITLSASQSFTAGRLATALAYGIGSAVALYFLMLGGRRVTRRLSQRSGRFQQALGAVMVLVAVLMLANLDVRFQNAIASDLPSFLVNPTGGLEKSAIVRKPLVSVRGGKPGRPETHVSAGSNLPKLGPAPEIQGTQQWFNTPGGRALTLASLRSRHRVVLIDFWTYTCINCIRTLPALKAWDAKYRSAGLTIIGVHTPEFPFEKDAGNVRAAVAQDGLRYPVAQDNNYATWNAYQNQYWPAHYLIDANGVVRYVHFGEGEYAQTESAIRSLLAEAGDAGRLGGKANARVQTPTGLVTPETYLGSARAERFDNGAIRDGVHDYGSGGAPDLAPDHLAYRGKWGIAPDGAVAGPGARLFLNFHARNVYLVLGSPDRGRRMQVLIDGRPAGSGTAGADVRGGAVSVGAQRLYGLVSLPKAGDHQLELRFAGGTRGYAFTFG